MKTQILMVLAGAILGLTTATWAVDTAPANLGDDVARLGDGVRDSLAGQSGGFHLRTPKYREDNVVVRLRWTNEHWRHDHWAELIDENGNVKS